MNKKNYTEAGTDIDEVKRLNAASGLSYNEVIALLMKESKGRVDANNTNNLNQSNKDFNGPR